MSNAPSEDEVERLIAQMPSAGEVAAELRPESGAGAAAGMSPSMGEGMLTAAKDSKILLLPDGMKEPARTVPVVCVLQLPAAIAQAPYQAIVDTLIAPTNAPKLIHGLAVMATRQALQPLDPQLIEAVLDATVPDRKKRHRH